jgi:enamine deaminase RidA (YjgF/YER057c/UK114 family)
MTLRRLQPEGRLSGAVVHGDTVYLAGQVADDTSLDTEGQTTDILAQIDALLAEAGTDKSRLISVQVFLADIRDSPGMNKAWDAWLDPANPPARATVEARLIDPSWRVEITAIAAVE